MNLAWQVALNEEKGARRREQGGSSKEQGGSAGFDGFLWLNDDVVLDEQALNTMLLGGESGHAGTRAPTVVIGACRGKDGEITYGAIDERGELIPPNRESQTTNNEPRWFCGNVVLVPRSVVNKIGIISDEYSHARADFDYAERLWAAKIPMVTTDRFVGVCENDFADKMRGKSLRERLEMLWQPGYFNLGDLWRIRSRYHGFLAAVLSCGRLVLELVGHKEHKDSALHLQPTPTPKIVIWAHSQCRSTAALYEELRRQSEWPVLIKQAPGIAHDENEAVREAQGIGVNLQIDEGTVEFASGDIHVFCGYQASQEVRQMIREAKRAGCRVFVYSEAPCEMCVGIKAWMKRMYYRFILPRKLRGVIRDCDAIITQSGDYGIERLLRLGWRRDQIIPFGYITDGLVGGDPRAPRGLPDGRACLPQTAENKNEPSTVQLQLSTSTNLLRILHLGSEAPYRGIHVLDLAVEIVNAADEKVILQKTGGVMTQAQVVDEIRAADLVVACGLCEPWGMRVNDALAEGKPVIVSDGMGVRWLVEKYGCGCVVPKGEESALAAGLQRCADDREFLARLRSGAERAREDWTPKKQAKEFLRFIGGAR